MANKKPGKADDRISRLIREGELKSLELEISEYEHDLKELGKEIRGVGSRKIKQTKQPAAKNRKKK